MTHFLNINIVCRWFNSQQRCHTRKEKNATHSSLEEKNMTSFYLIYLEDSASIGVADLVDTRLVHSQRDAVEENDGHTDPLEPRVEIIN